MRYARSAPARDDLRQAVEVAAPKRVAARGRLVRRDLVDGGQRIGLEETDDGIWSIHFNTVLLATFDEGDYIITG